MSKDRCEFVAAGLGGQGVLTMGLTLAKAGLKRFKYVTWLPNYDTFMRGGEVICYVILSQYEIASPIISRPKGMIFLSRPALDTYEELVTGGGTAILDSSLIDRQIRRNDLKAIYLPAMDMAQEIGSSLSMETAIGDLGSGFIPTRTIDIEAGEADFQPDPPRGLFEGDRGYAPGGYRRIPGRTVKRLWETEPHPS